MRNPVCVYGARNSCAIKGNFFFPLTPQKISLYARTHLPAEIKFIFEKFAHLGAQNLRILAHKKVPFRGAPHLAHKEIVKKSEKKEKVLFDPSLSTTNPLTYFR
jgi:hypothetical protein